MITTVTQKNMVTIPAAVGRLFHIQPGYRLEWTPIKKQGRGSDEMRVRVIPNKKALSRSLRGQGKKFSPRRESVRELVAERERET
jgi:bifunctional DNA-binding transcriptional regulator/antitoxin component of YhaV-PrlF toxin-antitoxin module